MSEAEHARLAEIEREFERLGVSSEWIAEYVHNLSIAYFGHVKLLLPPGTLPRYAYIKRLEELVKKLEKAREKPEEAQPNVIQNDLYNHLTRFKPIDAKAFHAAIDALIDEKIRILTNIRITEATNMLSC